MSPYLQVTTKRLLSRGMWWIPSNCCMAIPRKYPLHPQIPTRGMPSKPKQWVRLYHLVMPHLNLQVQFAGPRLHKYLSQTLVSPEKGRPRTTVAWTLFLLTKPTGWSLAITLRWLHNHNYNIWTQQPSLPLLVSWHKDKDLIISESRVGMKDIPWGRALIRGRTARLTNPNDEGNSTAAKKATKWWL